MVGNLIEGHAVSWFIIFVGGIILYYRICEKTFRDKLENIRRDLSEALDRSRYSLDENEELSEKEYAIKDRIDHLSYFLVRMTGPVQKQINDCSLFALAILIVEFLFISTKYFDLFPSENGYVVDLQYWTTLYFFIMMLLLSCEAYRIHGHFQFSTNCLERPDYLEPREDIKEIIDLL